MIPVNQLRLGNYFHPCSTKGGIIIPNTDIVWKVGMIDKFGKIAVIEPENHETLYLTANEAEPIPLTEEWLKDKFKLEENSVGTYFIKDRLIGIRQRVITDLQTSKQFHYVHRFQNFIYEHTEEELTIK